MDELAELLSPGRFYELWIPGEFELFVEEETTQGYPRNNSIYIPALKAE